MPLVSSTIPNLVGGVSQQPYTIRMASQCEEMVNCLPSVVDFLCRRPGTRHIAKIIDGKVSDAAIHIINRDSTEQYVVILAGNNLKIFDLFGNEKLVNFGTAKPYINIPTPSENTAFLTINDYTFILNKTVTAAMDTTTSPTRTPEALVFIKQASYATDYNVTLGGTTFTHSTYKDDNRRASDGLEFTTKNGFDMDNTAVLDGQRYKLSSSVIAADLASKINANTSYTCEVVKSTLWIRRTNSQDFTAEVSDSRSNTHISVTTNRIQRFSDLPIVAPNGYTTEITGDQSSSFDNYYVVFKTNNNMNYGDGVWMETVKPGIKTKLNASTMPHALVREADGSFTLKTLDWKPRNCGDEDSSPDPSFVGRKLASVFFYRNRLGLLSGENCIFSEAGEFFNFYPTTVTTMVDSDPIDVAASDTKAADLYHVVPFSEGMLLFSNQTQFVLEHDDNMSGKTTNVKPLTVYESSIKAQPIGLGKTIFFATNRGTWAGVREYFVEKDAQLTDAVDVTSHVPHYIPADIHKLVGSTNEDCLLALSSKDRQGVALYKYFWNDSDKLQSSWSKWSFTGELLSAAFINSTLILIIQYEDGVYLEALSLEPGYQDFGAPFEYCFDRKLKESDMVSVVFDDDTKTTTVTYPFPLSGEPQAVSRYPMQGEAEPAESLPAGVIYGLLSWEGNTAVYRGDLTGKLFVTGLPFQSLFRFSPQIIREDSGSGGKLAVTEGRLQLRNFTLTYGDTGYFEVHVTPEYRDTDVRPFTGRALSHGANIIGKLSIPSGTFRFPVLSKSDAVTIEIISNSYLPFQITSAGWEGFYQIRSRRI